MDFQLNSIDPDAKDGLEVLQKIKEFEKTICVIMLSSQDHYGKATQTIIKGALEYVVKNDEAFVQIDKILANLDWG